MLAALRATLLKHDIGRCELAALLNLSSGLAFRITGAREELPEPAALHSHWPSAVVAALFGGFRVSFVVGLWNVASCFARYRLCLSSRRTVFSGCDEHAVPGIKE
jgi:hypothetical protein